MNLQFFCTHPHCLCQRRLSGALCTNQMHPVFLQGNHQNLLKLLYTDSCRDMTNRRPRVRYHGVCSRASGAGPFATKWYCVKLARSVHDKLMQFQRCLWASGDLSDAGCGSFIELCRVLRFESLGAWKGFTWQATNNYTLLFPLYSITLPPLSPGLSFCEQARSASILTTHNKTLFFSDMINKRRPCRLNIFIRYIFHFCRQKPSLGSVRGLSCT